MRRHDLTKKKTMTKTKTKKKTKTKTKTKTKMSCLQVRAQVDAVVRVVTSTSPHFVLCFLPHHLAGLSEILRADRECALNQRLLREQVGDQMCVFVSTSSK